MRWRIRRIVNGCAAQLDCLSDRHIAVVAAHRAKPDLAAVENAMSGFAASFARYRE